MGSSTCLSCGKQITEAVAKGCCWACYQRDRRSRQGKRLTPACVEGRRYHSYDQLDTCRLCGAKRVFRN